MRANRDLPLNQEMPTWIHGAVLIMTLGFLALVSTTFLSETRAQQIPRTNSAKAQRIAPAAAKSPFKLVANVEQVMKVITIPSSDVIFAAAGDTPKTPGEWQTIQNNALLLAESGNLLMMPGRARDNQEWVKAAQAMIDASMNALNAASAKNADALADAGDKIYVTCETCHDKYMAK
jgi:hypothetical protein